MATTILQNTDLVRHFAWWSAAMSVKMLCMAPIIGFHRFRKQIFMNPEDAKFVSRNAKVAFDDPDIERSRRAFLNDLENILPWFISTSVYLTISPEPGLAINLMRTFCISRILHTFVYAVVPVRQPARLLCYVVGYAVIGYQAFATLTHYGFLF